MGESNCCKSGVIYVTTGVLGMALLLVGVSYANYKDHSQHQCHIANVLYPTSITDGPFVDCDCGKYCTSDRGTCIKVMVYYDDHEPVVMKEFVPIVAGSSPDSVCTFAERTCTDGESVEDRMNAILNAESRAQPYVQAMDNNQTITCFSRDSEDIYMENNDQLPSLIGVGCAFGVFLIIAILYTISINRKKTPDTNVV